MQAVTVLVDGIERVRHAARRAVEGLDVDALAWRPDGEANTIAWLVWHLARIQDDHVADVADRSQVWVEQDWAPRFGLSSGSLETGFGHTPEQVAAIRPADVDVLLDHLEAVTDRTIEVLEKTTDDELDRIVDESWDPPVSLGVRLVSVIEDGLQHAGQAAYVRGLWERR